VLRARGVEVDAWTELLAADALLGEKRDDPREVELVGVRASCQWLSGANLLVRLPVIVDNPPPAVMWDLVDDLGWRRSGEVDIWPSCFDVSELVTARLAPSVSTVD